MRRRSRLSLDPGATDADKSVPGFESGQDEAHEDVAPSVTLNDRRSKWSSAPGTARRIDATEQHSAPPWQTTPMVKGLMAVVLGAIGFYLLRKRLF